MDGARVACNRTFLVEFKRRKRIAIRCFDASAIVGGVGGEEWIGAVAEAATVTRPSGSVDSKTRSRCVGGIAGDARAAPSESIESACAQQKCLQ